jgi:hypothetical protein
MSIFVVHKYVILRIQMRRMLTTIISPDSLQKETESEMLAVKSEYVFVCI